ncbi:syntaxin-6-like [Tubulanus polymorphus]|uniref:syntaxin-6-like n=1 Tax=Tubulanus polymorphus TaxID=672921 RepID=UPI003DA567E1
MSMEDPFFVVKEEVNKALNTSQGLYQRWCELVNDPNSVSKEEFEWTSNELRNCLRSIDWDLEDLDETIGIVEKNPKKFKIDELELVERRQFVTTVRRSVNGMREHMSSPKKKNINENGHRRQANGPSRPQDKYTRLDNEIERANDKYITDTQQQQQMMMNHQDEHLNMIGTSVTVLKDMSHRIGGELDEQAVMLDDFSTEMDHTESRLDQTMKKMAKVLHMSNDRRQWIAIAVLVVILIIVLVLFFVL